jgi:hypothetical protein
MTVRPALGHSNTMRIRSVFVVAGLMLRCGGSTLVGNNDAQPHPADGSSPSMTADTGGGDEGAILSGADATAASRVDGSATATGPGAGPCSFFTCPDGCCLDDGGCFAYSGESTDIPCGSNGEACRTCPSGESCIPNVATAGPSIGRAGRSGGCQRDLGEPCTPENCAGCCFVADVSTDSGSVFSTQCFEGSQDNYCGSAGTACLRCTPATNGGHCVADSTGGGHCEGAGQCNATNAQVAARGLSACRARKTSHAAAMAPHVRTARTVACAWPSPRETVVLRPTYADTTAPPHSGCRALHTALALRIAPQVRERAPAPPPRAASRAPRPSYRSWFGSSFREHRSGSTSGRGSARRYPARATHHGRGAADVDDTRRHLPPAHAWKGSSKGKASVLQRPLGWGLQPANSWRHGRGLTGPWSGPAPSSPQSEAEPHDLKTSTEGQGTSDSVVREQVYECCLRPPRRQAQ